MRAALVIACACAVARAGVCAAAALPPPDDKPPEAVSEALGNAKTRRDVRAVAKDIDAYVATRLTQRAAGDLLMSLSQTWYRVGDYQAAVNVLRRLTADWPSHGGVAWLGLAETYDKLGDERQVVASLEQAVGAQGFDMHRDIMDADNTTNMAVRWLGAIYERRKQWQQARALYERWKPASWCGNEAEDYAHERAIRIALMDDRLGAGDEAASALKTILDAPGLNGFDLRVGLAYVELAARHGKTKAVRAEISGLEETEADARKRLRGALRMAARYEARDAAGLLDAAAPRLSREPRSRDYQPPEGAMAARLLADLGAPAWTELSRRIERGDLAAIRIAGLTHERSLLAGLRARRRAESSPSVRAALSDAAARVAHDTSL